MRHDYRRSHPALKTGKELLWFGQEIELPGLLGMFTAFIAGPLSEDQVELMKKNNVQHIFLTETFSDWKWYIEEIRNSAMESGTPVTHAVTEADAHVFLAMRNTFLPEINVVVRVFGARWTGLLREGKDKISVGAPYNMRTFEVDGSSLVVSPWMYEKDSVL